MIQLFPSASSNPNLSLQLFFLGDFLAGPTQIASFPPKEEHICRDRFESQLVSPSFSLWDSLEQRDFDQ